MEEWMKDDLVRDIPVQKLKFLENMMGASRGRKQKDFMQTMLAMLKDAKEQGLQFTPQETAAAIAAIRKHSDETENKKIDDLLKKVDQITGKKEGTP